MAPLKLRQLRTAIPVLLLAALPAFSDTGRNPESSTTKFVVDSVSIPSLNLPPGFHPERTIRLDSVNGPVDLAFGNAVACRWNSRNSLSVSEWEWIVRDVMPNGLSVAAKKDGKEVSIVFLEEKRGKFLLIRRME